jgi:hypothetical protein
VGIIVKIDNIQPAFNNAHRVMWAKHSNGQTIPVKSTLPTQWWKKEYDVKIITGYKVDQFGREYQDAWIEAEFPSKEYLTWFMLKWS